MAWRAMAHGAGSRSYGSFFGDPKTGKATHGLAVGKAVRAQGEQISVPLSNPSMAKLVPVPLTSVTGTLGRTVAVGPCPSSTRTEADRSFANEDGAGQAPQRRVCRSGTLL